MMNHNLVARSLFLSSFAAFLFTGVFASAAVSGGIALEKEAAPVVSKAITPSIIIKADKENYEYGETAYIQWTVSNAKSCAISSTPGVKIDENNATEDGVPVGPLKTNTTVTVKCISSSKTEKSASVTLPVAAGKAPVVTVTATPSEVEYNGTSAISWTSTGADICKAYVIQFDNKISSFGLGLSAKGKATQALRNGTAYAVECVGPTGVSTIGSAVVKVKPVTAPTVTIKADKTSVKQGEIINISLESKNAKICTLRDGTGTIALSKSNTASVAAKKSTVIWAMCEGDGGTAVSSVSIDVASASFTPKDPPAIPTTFKTTIEKPICVKGARCEELEVQVER